MSSKQTKGMQPISALYSIEQALQDGLNGAMARVDTQPTDAIFHAIRAGILEIPTKAYTESIGMTSSRVALDSHRKGSPPSIGIMKDPNRFRILDDWQRRALREADPVCRQILLDARVLMADLFTAHDKGAGTSWGYLRTMRLLAGRKNYEEHAPVSKQTISKRQEDDRLGHFGDILATARSTGLTRKDLHPAELWHDPTVARGRGEYYRHATERDGCDACATTLHMLLTTAGYESDMLSLERDWGMRRSEARLLSAKKRIPFSAVEDILGALRRSKEADPAAVAHLADVWKGRAEDGTHSAETFGNIIRDGLGRNDVTLADLNRYFGIETKAPQRRSATGLALDRGDFFEHAPFIAFAPFALGTAKEIQDAIALKREELLSALQRRDGAVRKHIIAERRLCGVRENELPYDSNRYRAFENGGSKSRLKEHDVLTRIRSIGLEKVRVALEECFRECNGGATKRMSLQDLMRWILGKNAGKTARIPEDIGAFMLDRKPSAKQKMGPDPAAMVQMEAPTVADLLARISIVHSDREKKKRADIETVQELCRQIIAKTSGGADSAGKEMNWDQSFSKKVRISPFTMREIGAGRTPRHFPTLPVLRHMAKSHDFPVTQLMHEDWASQYATYLKRRGYSPLRRILNVMIGETASSQTDFCKNIPDFNDIALSNILRKIDKGEHCDEEELRPILIETGVVTSPERMTLVRCFLHGHNAGCTGNALIQRAVHQWRKEAKKHDWPETTLALLGIDTKGVHSRPLPTKKR